MRISDWSSDVCSSDLAVPCALALGPVGIAEAGEHHGGGCGQEGGDAFLCFGRGQPDGGGDFGRGRHREARGVEEGKEFEQRSKELTSELQPLMRISYGVFCLMKNRQ